MLLKKGKETVLSKKQKPKILIINKIKTNQLKKDNLKEILTIGQRANFNTLRQVKDYLF